AETHAHALAERGHLLPGDEGVHRGLRPGSREPLLDQELQGVGAQVHGPMIGLGEPYGKSIVIIIFISYFLRLDGPPARPPPDARGGRAPRLLLARRARAPPHPARREHAGAPARADARPAAPRARRQACLPDEGGRAAPRPRGPRAAGARDGPRSRPAAPRDRRRADPPRDERLVLDLPLAAGPPAVPVALPARRAHGR